MIKSIITMLILILGSGCKNDTIINSSNISKDSTTIDFNVTGNIIPLKIGNYWKYVDSLFWFDSLRVTTYSIRVDSFYLYRSDTIWVLFYRDSYGDKYPHTELRISNDSVFTIGRGESLRYESLEYLVPANYDSTFYFATIGGDVVYKQCAVKLKKGFSTIHGIIEGCISIGSSPQMFTIIKPGIGIIYHQESSTTSTYYRRKHLIELTLK